MSGGRSYKYTDEELDARICKLQEEYQKAWAEVREAKVPVAELLRNKALEVSKRLSQAKSKRKQRTPLENEKRSRWYQRNRQHLQEKQHGYYVKRREKKHRQWEEENPGSTWQERNSRGGVIPVPRLESWMRSQGLSSYGLALRLGVNTTTINRIRRGIVKPSWPLIEKIAEASEGKVMADDFMRSPEWAMSKRDPARWFAYITCDDNIPHVFGRGITEAQATDNANDALHRYGAHLRKGIKSLPQHLHTVPPDQAGSDPKKG
jgi:transcriptional regulator with XRE-family HTH domain